MFSIILSQTKRSTSQLIRFGRVLSRNCSISYCHTCASDVTNCDHNLIPSSPSVMSSWNEHDQPNPIHHLTFSTLNKTGHVIEQPTHRRSSINQTISHSISVDDGHVKTTTHLAIDADTSVPVISLNERFRLIDDRRAEDRADLERQRAEDLANHARERADFRRILAEFANNQPLFSARRVPLANDKSSVEKLIKETTEDVQDRIADTTPLIESGKSVGADVSKLIDQVDELQTVLDDLESQLS